MNSDNVVPIEVILYRYFVKYERLDEIIKQALGHSKACTANLFIDIYGLYRTILSRSYHSALNNFTSFTPTMINMCSHYRTYFKQMRVYPKIFLISGFNVPELNRKFVAEYNKTMIDKLRNEQAKEIVEFNCSLLDILCPYLPDIHFINCGNYESSVLIKAIIEKERSNGNFSPNIIISSDIYPMQLCYQYDDTVFLRPLKSFGVDNSLITCERNNPIFAQSFWRLIGSSRTQLENGENNIRISPVNYPLLSALTRYPERGLKSYIRLDVAERSIFNLVQSNNISITPEMIYQEPDIGSRITLNLLDTRFKALDISYQYMVYNESLDHNTLRYENLDDPDAVQMINNTYFKDNPIDIFHL